MTSYRLEFEGVLPRILLHARIVFRDVRCPHEREDRIAEVIAISWKWWLRLRERGKNPTEFVRAIATYAGRAVRSGGTCGPAIRRHEAGRGRAGERAAGWGCGRSGG